MMMNSRVKTIDIPGIGVVDLRKNRRSRHIRITVPSPDRTRVTLPWWVPYREAIDFVQRKSEWIRRQKDELMSVMQKDPFPSMLDILDEGKARAALKNRAVHLANMYGFRVDRIAVRNQRTRWGSCRGYNINLNIKLLCVEEDLRDYVILHELVHTRIKDHSGNFWAHLELIMPGARDLDRKLKLYRLDML